MTLFDDVRRSLSHAGKQAAEKTKELTDAVRLRAKLGSEREELEKQYAAVGKEVYTAARPEDQERFETVFREIAVVQERIAGLEKELAVLDGRIFCAECGARIEKGSVFCSKCGVKVGETMEAETPKEAAGEETGAGKDAAKETAAGDAADSEKVGCTAVLEVVSGQEEM
ncbi:MAG: zinc-ribbon domain-containing protein [Lachnospiraceae bacterium]|nr:zinc-ribbon domain-containing protein [Lachnospiraceae bacterium]